jgi:hypothetical protein
MTHIRESKEELSAVRELDQHLPLRRHAPVHGQLRIGDRPVTVAGLRIDSVIVACAVSSGIHAALVPDHFKEGTGAGVGFVVATVLLGVLAVVVTRSPSQVALAGAAAVFAGLIASYLLAITTGVPVLHPDVEAVDGLAVFTKAVEAIGFVAAASLVKRPSSRTLPQPKGILT